MSHIYNRFFIGIDNGISGTIAIIGYSPTLGTAVYCFKTPAVSQQNYTKKKANITRVNGKKLMDIFSNSIPKGSDVHVMMERPMVNPKMFHATLSAVRALEATQTILETLEYPYTFVDSKQWQSVLLPVGTKGEALKPASLDIGERMYPGVNPKGHKDADGLLIAHFCMLQNK